MSGARHRRKGDRIERELVDRHRALGTHPNAIRCLVPADFAAPATTSISIFLVATKHRSSAK
jgi:hypothetical protein